MIHRNNGITRPKFRKEKWSFLSPDNRLRVDLGKIEKIYLNFCGRDVQCPLDGSKGKKEGTDVKQHRK
jgi:hypothetical protein